MFGSAQGTGFEGKMTELETYLSQAVHTAEELEKVLNGMYESLFDTDFAGIDVHHVTGEARELLRALFGIRIRLRDELTQWDAKGLMTPAAQASLRNVFRILRYASDMFGELAIGHARPSEDEGPFEAFTGPHFNTLVNERFGGTGDLTFEPGDVILVRGGAHNSAAIARIGDIDSQFSHVGMVYADNVGRRYCVEAIIEEGSIVRPLEHMLRHGNIRAVLFRHKDPVLAKKAADLMFEHVEKSARGEIPHIPYDFTMRLTGEKELFCSKLIRLAYLKASDGNYVMPRFPTKLSLKNRDFIDRIGVQVNETFAPGDMELEPDFDLVAEWRDYRFTSKLRLQDMVMLKILDWMELLKYKFKQRFPIGLISFFGKLSAYLSKRAKELLSDVVPNVPRNMTRRTIAAIIMLHKTAEPILEKMVVLEEAHIKETGRQLHPRVVLEEVERIRKAAGRRIGYLVRPLIPRR